MASKTIKERRIEFDALLRAKCPNAHIYYQPPEGIKMEYPAIRYKRADLDNDFADDLVYKQADMYELTVIDLDPDSVIANAVSRIPRSRFGRQYISDNLNHITFTIYF